MMTTGILDALMRLFALFAAGRSSREAMLGRQAASRYLLGRLSRSVTEDYLKEYDEALMKFNRKMQPSVDETLLAKRRAKLSVKLLVICSKIKGELAARDRLVVFTRLAELAKSTGTIDDSDSFLNAVGNALNLNDDDVVHVAATAQVRLSQEPHHQLTGRLPRRQLPDSVPPFGALSHGERPRQPGF